MIRFLALLLLTGTAIGATVGELEPAGGTWRVYRGTGFSAYVCRGSSEAAALACAAKDADAREAKTRYQIRYPNRYVTVTYTLPDSTPVDCAVSPWGTWDGGTWGACTNGTQTRQETRARTVLTQPANGGAACPALTEARTVTQPCGVEPPPTGVLFTDDFRTGDLSHTENGVRWLGRGEKASVVSTSASPSGKALRLRYPAASDGQDSWAEQRLILPNLTDVYIQITARIPDKYCQRSQSSGGNNNKAYRVWNGDLTDSNDGYTRYYLKGGNSTVPAANCGSSLITEWGRRGGGDERVGRNNTPSAPDWITAEDRGRVVKFTFHARTDTKGQAGAKNAATGGNGALEAWKNDRQVASFTNLIWRSADGKNEMFSRAYLWGWANTGFDDETPIDIYSVTISTSKPAGLQ